MSKYFLRSAKRRLQFNNESSSSDEDLSENPGRSSEQDLKDINIESPTEKNLDNTPIVSEIESEGGSSSQSIYNSAIKGFIKYSPDHSPDDENTFIMPDNTVLNPQPKLDKDFALKFIPEFNGSKDNFHKFSNCCDLLHDENYSQIDKDLYLNIIKAKLTGPAYNVIKYKTFETWADLKKILTDQFLECRAYAHIQNDLIVREVEKFEKCEKFC